MSVTLDGRKIGHMQTLREERDGRIVTTQALDVQLERDAGIGVDLFSSETSGETMNDGKPLAFSARARVSGSETLLEVSCATMARSRSLPASVDSLTARQPQTRRAASGGLRRHAPARGPGARYALQRPGTNPPVPTRCAMDTTCCRGQISRPAGRRRRPATGSKQTWPCQAATKRGLGGCRSRTLQRADHGPRLPPGNAHSQACARLNQGTDDAAAHDLLRLRRSRRRNCVAAARYTLVTRGRKAPRWNYRHRLAARAASAAPPCAWTSPRHGDTRNRRCRRPRRQHNLAAVRCAGTPFPGARCCEQCADDAARMPALKPSCAATSTTKPQRWLRLGAGGGERARATALFCRAVGGNLSRALGIPRVVDGLASPGASARPSACCDRTPGCQAWVDGHWRG